MTRRGGEEFLLNGYSAQRRMFEYARALRDMPGWFETPDVLLFQKIDHMQRQEGLKGDLLEIGVYKGKSAILLGFLCRPHEHLVVCDLFESAVAPSEANSAEMESYVGVSRRGFEENYLAFHEGLPHILACSSAELRSHGLGRSFRFIHVDGSHLYEVVRFDIETARGLLIEGGVVVLDDFMNPHTPGVSAAVWEEMLGGGLVPLCFTAKLYGHWGPGREERLAALRSWASAHPLLRVESHVVFGHELLLIARRARKPSVVRRLAGAALPPGLLTLARLLRRVPRSWTGRTCASRGVARMK